jgi:hypothetical protein
MTHVTVEDTDVIVIDELNESVAHAKLLRTDRELLGRMS